MYAWEKWYRMMHCICAIICSSRLIKTISCLKAQLTTASVTWTLNIHPLGSIHSNGKTTAYQIRKVVDKYKVSKFVCVRHSKGGLDIQGVILYYNMAPRIGYTDC